MLKTSKNVLASPNNKIPKQQNEDSQTKIRASLTQKDSGFSSGFLSNLSDPSMGSSDLGSTSHTRFLRTPEKLREEVKVQGTPTKLHYGLHSPKIRQKTPRKRKMDLLESDENFYNSLNFVSPLKQKPNQISRAKLILKEKCSSENVIPLSSTPLKEKEKLWGRFKTFHPQKHSSIDKSIIEEEAENVPPFHQQQKQLEEINESSINFTNPDFSNFDSTNFLENQTFETAGTPSAIGALCTAPINSIISDKLEKLAIPKIPQELVNRQHSQRDYSGTLHVDILRHLVEKDITGALDLILHDLSDSDLLSLCQVSKSHRKVVETNRSAQTRRTQYLEKFRSSKENKNPSAANVTVDKSVTIPTSKSAKKRKVFGRSNIDVNAFNASYNRPYYLRSPSVSPGKRKFHENQRIVRNRKHVKFMKCPRCKASSSIARKKRVTKKKQNSYSLRSVSLRNQTFQQSSIAGSSAMEKTSIFGDLSDSGASSPPSSPSSDEMSFVDKQIDSDEEYEIATCEKKSCGFKFCPKCQCKVHPKKKCGNLSPASPTHKDQSQNSSLACSIQSRKSLRRLCFK